MQFAASTCLSVLLAAAASAAAPATRPSSQPAPKVDVVFVLDTTGSMGGLIEGAKAKIWHIAHQIVRGEPRPVVRMGLVAYRDKGDEYVTRVVDLTDNIDKIYIDLRAFVAAGGGDGPEHVNQALHDAVHKMNWSPEPKALKIIYLVGDAPPHNEYTDVSPYQKLAKAAIQKGIYVNTVQCGGDPNTAVVWQEIARRAEGKYVAIAQDGGVQTVATPYDEELSTLNAQLTGTVIVYGLPAERESLRRLNASAASAPAAVAADRALYAAHGGRAGAGDLIVALDGSDVDLDGLSEAQLPEEMRNMKPEERERYVADKRAKRDELRKKISALGEKREAFIRKAAESRPASDAFDASVVEALRVQAAKKGIRY